MTMADVLTCPICGSSNLKAEYYSDCNARPSISVLCDCRNCGSDWLAVYEFVFNEEIYDATKRREA